MSEQSKPPLKFKNEAQERTFWESKSRDSTEYLDWAKAQRVVLPNLKLSTKTISLRLSQHLLDSIKAAANAMFRISHSSRFGCRRRSSITDRARLMRNALWLGVGENHAPLHSPRYDFEDSLVDLGWRSTASFARGCSTTCAG